MADKQVGAEQLASLAGVYTSPHFTYPHSDCERAAIEVSQHLRKGLLGLVSLTLLAAHQPQCYVLTSTGCQPVEKDHDMVDSNSRLAAQTSNCQATVLCTLQ